MHFFLRGGIHVSLQDARRWLTVVNGAWITNKKMCKGVCCRAHFSAKRVKMERKVESVVRATPKLAITIFILSALFLDFKRQSMTASKSWMSFFS